jgi:hypothetical protein
MRVGIDMAKCNASGEDVAKHLKPTEDDALDHDAHVQMCRSLTTSPHLEADDLEFRPGDLDVEGKMAIHFAHDANDPAHLERLKAQKIPRFRNGEWSMLPRWTENDEKERGGFRADKFAFGNIEVWVDLIASQAMSADPSLTLDAARGGARRSLNPRNLRIRNPQWSAERQQLKHRRNNARRSADADLRRQERERVKAYRAVNPDKVKSSRKADAAAEKAARAARGPNAFVAVDSEGFDRGRYFVLSDAVPRDEYGRKIADSLDPRSVARSIERWSIEDRDWYESAHDLEPGAMPSAQTKTFEGDIYREHKSFLWGAGNDEKQRWLCRSADGEPKVALSTPEIFDWLIGLKRDFPHSVFAGYSFSYDATMTLAGLDYDAALALQKGERKTVSDDEFEAMSETERDRYIERHETVFWGEYAIAYRKGKMFRVGRLRDPAKPWKIKSIKDPEKNAAYKPLACPRSRAPSTTRRMANQSRSMTFLVSFKRRFSKPSTA